MGLEVDKLLDSLSESQRKVVTAPINKINKNKRESKEKVKGEYMQIIAGPGSGKTNVLTKRVYWLIKNGVNPQSIVLITFTRKAATEMKERLITLLGEDKIKGMYIGTFHSICYKLLRRNFSRVKEYTNTLEIADESISEDIFKKVLKKVNCKKKISKKIISKLKSEGITLKDYFNLNIDVNSNKNIRKYKHEHNPSKDDNIYEIYEIYEMYENMLKDAGFIDLDDILLYASKLIQDYPTICKQFHTILVDEFQDTNKIQLKLCYQLSKEKKNLTVVGDPNQCIYSFRNAFPDVFDEMKRNGNNNHENNDKVNANANANTKSYFLDINYRSTDTIITASDLVIKGGSDGNNIKKVSYPKQKPINSMNCDSFIHKENTPKSEIKYVLKTIKNIIEMSNNRFKFSDFAILSRTSSLFSLYEIKAFEFSIPYKTSQNLSIMERFETSILVDFLRIVNGSTNNLFWERTLKYFKCRIGPVSFKKIKDYSLEYNIDILDSIKELASLKIKNKNRNKPSSKIKNTGDTGSGETILRYCKIIEIARQIAEENSDEQQIIKVLKFLVKSIKLNDHIIAKYPETKKERMDRINLFCSLNFGHILKNFDNEIENEHVNKGNINVILNPISKFLSYAALNSSLEDDSNYFAKKNAVTISTIHSAKGLQWPIVFIVGLNDLTRHGIPPLFANNLDEERRILYVGMTRAQISLFLSGYSYEDKKKFYYKPPPPYPFSSFLPRKVFEILKKGFKINDSYIKKISHLLDQKQGVSNKETNKSNYNVDNEISIGEESIYRNKIKKINSRNISNISNRLDKVKTSLHTSLNFKRNFSYHFRNQVELNMFRNTSFLKFFESFRVFKKGLFLRGGRF